MAEDISTYIEALIYDRTQADVDYLYEVKDRLQRKVAIPGQDGAAWLTDLKGAYNASDLNRVSLATEKLGEYMADIEDELTAYRLAHRVGASAANDMPYASADIITHAKTDWTEADIPTHEQGQNYTGDVQLLRDCAEALLGTDAPEVPDINGLTWDGANDIENLLRLIYEAVTAADPVKRDIIDRTAACLDYTGLLTCGGV